MNLDLDTVKQAFGTIGTTITILKQAKELLPESTKKREVSDAIEDAERQLKIAESQSAQVMGYEICRNHFPPEIMLSADNINWKCPVCGNTKSPKPRSKSPWGSLSGD